MSKKNTVQQTLPEEPTPVEQSDIEEDEFDGPINSLELEDDEFDDLPLDIDETLRLSHILTTPKNTTSFPTIIDKKIPVPAKFICPLSKQMMMEPVRIAGSKVPIAYEKSAIEAYYEEHGEDPMTNESLGDDADFTPDLALKREISDFCLAHTTT